MGMNSWDELLKIGRCPIDHSPLAEADRELLERLNAAIEAGQVRDRIGQPVDQPVQAALVNRDCRWLYPVIDGIPSLIADEALDVQQLAGPPPREEQT